MRRSIAWKLGNGLVWRLVGVFLAIDVIICLITAGALIYHAETKAAEAAALLSSAGFPGDGESRWLGLSGVSMERVVFAPRGVKLPPPFSGLLPESTDEAFRSVETTAELGATFRERLYSLDYVVTQAEGAYYNRINVALGPFVRVFGTAFIILAAFELLTLLSQVGKNRRMIRRVLDPITELTRAAQSLNAASKKLDPEKTAALAGKLEGIDAARLDTRIHIEDTQEELRSLARAINAMLDRINESYKAQVRFVSDASHELRTPISVIQGYANLLDRWGKNDEDALRESIGAIKEEAANMKELVEQLLFLARGDNDTIILQAEDFNLSELISEVAAETGMLDNTHDLEVKPGDAVVHADRALVKQALRILVDNAVKYTDPGGKITIASGTEEGTAKLSVTDEGIGISPEAVPHIFDRFYRTDKSRSRATGGAGLGLAIAKWIASRHDGHIEVLSREGIGTRISILLPATEEEGRASTIFQARLTY